MTTKKIAILGATGHIAKGLIDEFCRKRGYRLFLFAKSPERLKQFLEYIGCNDDISTKMFGEFDHFEYDTIINCVGIGDPCKLKEAGTSIFRLTEEYDNLVLNHLETHPQTLSINFSSGAAYGTEFSIPVDETTYARVDINHISQNNFYGIAKMNAEAKHRASPGLNIVDLRVFGYFSRFIDTNARYFLNEVISCAKENKIFMTGPDDITRDYVNSQDLFSMVEKCLTVHSLNDVFDVYSKKPITKFEILDYFTGQYGLKYVVKEDMHVSSATGTKENYYSNNKKAEKIGYFPRFTSLDTIREETKALLSANV